MEEISSLKTYTLTYIALMIFLALTVAASFLPIGPFTKLISLAIAMAKALLVVLFFMHVKRSPQLIWIYSGAGVAWLLIALILTMSDYFTRPSAFPGGFDPLR